MSIMTTPQAQAIIEAFPPHRCFSVREAAEVTGMSPSTTHRIIREMGVALQGCPEDPQLSVRRGRRGHIVFLPPVDEE